MLFLISFIVTNTTAWKTEKIEAMGREKEGYVQIEGGHCLECGNEIVYGRLNRKFCCKECRYSYHNHAVRPLRVSRARIIGAIDRNYLILSGLVNAGIRQIPIAQILDMGFDLTHVTSVTKVRRHLEISIFDIRYRQTETKLMDITKISVNLPSRPRHR